MSMENDKISKNNYFYLNILFLKVFGIFSVNNTTKFSKVFYNIYSFLIISFECILVLTECMYYLTVKENILSDILNNIYITITHFSSIYKLFYVLKNQSKILETIHRCSFNKWCTPRSSKEERLMKDLNF